jgi:hypothetical protein
MKVNSQLPKEIELKVGRQKSGPEALSAKAG